MSEEKVGVGARVTARPSAPFTGVVEARHGHAVMVRGDDGVLRMAFEYEVEVTK